MYYTSRCSDVSVVEIRIATSLISEDQALVNLNAECPLALSFNQVKNFAESCLI